MEFKPCHARYCDLIPLRVDVNMAHNLKVIRKGPKPDESWLVRRIN